MISVIIPIYNAGNKISRILGSIQNQKFEDYEVILVNDGSSDNTEDICKAAVKSDKRMRYYYQENQGASVARNYGIEVSQGEYITFLDADDEIADNYFNELFDACKDVDIAVCDVIGKTEQGKEIFRFSLEKQILNRIEALNYLFMREGINSGPCAKIFKREIIKNLRFPILKAYEDILFVKEAFCNAKNIAVINSTAYYYIRNEGSVMDSFWQNPSEDVIIASENIINLLLSNKEFNPKCLYITLSHLYQYIIPLLPEMTKYREFIEKVRKVFKKYYKFIFCSMAFPWKEKIVYGLFCLGWSYHEKKFRKI